MSVPAYINKAECAKLEAEAAYLTAQAAKERAIARKERALATTAEISLAKNQAEEAKRLAGNEHHGVIYFSTPVEPATAATCIERLDQHHRLHPGAPVEIIFTSPGGDVTAGMRLFDHICAMRREGHTVTIGTRGMAASMAGILLQAGDVRWCGAESYVLIHQISASLHGSFGEIEDRVDWFKKCQKRILDIFAERCKQAGENGTASKPASRAYLDKQWRRTDWWLDSSECLRLGIVDEIR